jgi:glycosyltransferase involved in cell wall biosynthesis
VKNIKIACIGSYVPRQCGIATFTRNILYSITKSNKEKKLNVDGYVIAMNDGDETYDYPEEVVHVIRQDSQRDYLKALKFIKYSDADVCLLQHEFGIFGGENGMYILPLIHRLEIPLIVTFHTILKDPSYNEKTVLEEIGKRAEKIIVMSKLAIDFLTKTYNIPRKKIALVEHGVPDLNFDERKNYKNKLNLEDKKSLMTFGLLSRDKGIETVIEALPKIVPNHPEIVYVVLGKTHPSVLRASGEEYRNYLKRLVERNNLRKHVHFYNRYVSNEELLAYLTAIDVYVTPYLNEAQITSGTLSYAIGAGAAVISTPYWHAKELLSDGRGRLFDFGDSNALADIINDLLDRPLELLALREKAYNYGRKIIWPEIGVKYLELISNSIESQAGIRIKKESIINPLVLPPFSLAHVKRLTDNTGIIQHAKYIVPNLKEGYTLDDNARALLMSLMTYRQKKEPFALELVSVYLGYIYYMQNDDGKFRNLLSFNREFLDEIGSEDSFGRAIWALGYLVRFAPNEAYFQLAREMFIKASPHFERGLESIRGMANTIIGICHYLHHFSGDRGMKKILNEITYEIVKRYEDEKKEDWLWFEPILSYDNGIIPLALFHSFEITEDKKVIGVATESMEYLGKVTLRDGYVSLVGSDNWYERGGHRSQYAQQAIDAMSMVLMFYQAFVVTKNKEYLNKMFTTFLWFLGENDLGLPLYDFETCGCCDGLEMSDINQNQGAESTLAYLISHLTVLLAHE